MPAMVISLPKLRHLVSLAEEGNFTRAAERLGMTQPSLSRSISELEQSCGLRLFDRGRLGVTPTAAGADLVQDARRILGQVHAVEQNLLLQSRGEAGRVALGIGPLATSWLLEALLAECLRRWPLLKITTSVDSTEMLIDKVMDGQLDFCICGANALDPGLALAIRRIKSVRLGYFVRADHPLTRTDAPLAWSDLAPYPRASGTMHSPHETARPAVFGPLDVTVECDDYNILRCTMLRTDTIWLGSERLLRAELEEGLVREIHPDEEAPPIVAEMALVRLAGRSVSPAARQVMDVITRLIGRS